MLTASISYNMRTAAVSLCKHFSLCRCGAREADGVWSRLNHLDERYVVSLSERIFEAVDDG